MLLLLPYLRLLDLHLLPLLRLIDLEPFLRLVEFALPPLQPCYSSCER